MIERNERRKKQGLRKARIHIRYAKACNLVTGEERWLRAVNSFAWCRLRDTMCEYFWFERYGGIWCIHKSACQKWKILPVEEGDMMTVEELAQVWEKYFRPDQQQ